jgi:O-antigen ligase
MLMITAGLTPVTVIYMFSHPKTGQTFMFIVLTLLTSLLSGLLLLSGRKKLISGIKAIHILIALAVLIVLLSVVHSKVPVYSFRNALLPLAALLFWLHVVFSRNRVSLLRKMTNVLLILSAFLSVYGIAQYLGFEFIEYSEQVHKNTVKATIGHPNHLSSFLGPCLFLAIGNIVMTRLFKYRILYTILLLIIISCIALARTRAIWLGAFCGFASMFMIGLLLVGFKRISFRHWLFLQMLTGIILGFLALAVFVIIPGVSNLPGIDKKFDLKGRISSDVEIKSRLYYWKAAIDMGLADTMRGQGYAGYDTGFWNYTLDHFKTSEGRYYKNIIPSISGSTPEHVHNEYLEIFCELGYPGLFVILSILGFFIYFGFIRIFSQESLTGCLHILCCFSGMLLILVDAVFSFPWRLPASLLTTIIIFAWVYEYIYPTRQADDADRPGRGISG